MLHSKSRSKDQSLRQWFDENYDKIVAGESLRYTTRLTRKDGHAFNISTEVDSNLGVVTQMARLRSAYNDDFKVKTPLGDDMLSVEVIEITDTYTVIIESYTKPELLSGK